MGVIDGQAVSAEVTNPAFINKNINDVMPNVLGFSNPGSGANIANIQQAINNLYTASGVSDSGGSAAGTAYNATAGTITNGEPYVQALRILANKFDALTGHMHTGSAGDGPVLASSGLSGVPLLAYTEHSPLGYFSVTGSSLLLPTFYKTPSTAVTATGVPALAAFNRVYVLGTNDQELVDSSGYTVYGRLTYSATGAASGWLLSFYSAPAGVETAYSFGSSTAIDFYFQELFNPLVPTPPGYTCDLIAKNGNTTQSVIVATTTLAGKVTLASSAPGQIAAAGASGTANGTVANANHTHAAAAIWSLSEWVESASSPETIVDNNNKVYQYAASGSQMLYTLVKVPTQYVSGTQIRMKSDFYTSATSGTGLLQTIATLVRQGTDAMTSTTNQRTSTNSAATVPATASVPTGVTFDLTDSSGNINGVSVSPGDFINVQLTRSSTDSCTANLNVPVNGMEVTFI